MPKIGVIISSTRDTRFGDKPAQWICNAASARTDLESNSWTCATSPCPSLTKSPRTYTHRRKMRWVSAGRRGR
jgi:NAD(P)H-dependent FMN reductase